MQVHRQRCQKCGSIDLRNLISRDSGQAAKIYVRCAKCRELVAFYELSRYYHHGKGIESYLRAHGVGAADSARTWMAEFERLQNEAIGGYEEALENLQSENKDV